MKILQTEQEYSEGLGTYSIKGLIRQNGEFDSWFYLYKNLKSNEVDAKESELLEMSEKEFNQKFNYEELEEA